MLSRRENVTLRPLLASSIMTASPILRRPQSARQVGRSGS
jgi:hypothetical protein